MHLPERQINRISCDIVAALVLLAALAPLQLLLAVLIKLDGGPVLYRHERAGLHGRIFQCLKFRTTAEKACGLRVTHIGRVLRATNLDELPQLLNVLRGEKSLLPRAETRSEMPFQGEPYFPDVNGSRRD